MKKNLTTFTGIILAIILSSGCSLERKPFILDEKKFAESYFGTDAKWYLNNIPFFECSDKKIEQVYYYRWKLYKAHIREVGNNKYVITEFINHVAWDREPYCTINAASMHHIYEGRWLKDNRYLNGYINNLYSDGGNNRQYSESIADATYARYLVNADETFVIHHLDSMKSKYTGWSDHWDKSKNLYYIPAMPDATEYTIASVDASGGKAGFDGGDAFRPTINSYMYGNALAISKIAKLKGDEKTSDEYLNKATELKQNIQTKLWNDSLQYFTDRLKQNNEYVHYWNFIRGRELAGIIPWYFNLPADTNNFNAAWKHIIDTSGLLGPYGFRTNEPSYEYYFKQFVYNFGQRGSQWNGPSWPYQSSQAITAMANLLNNYHQSLVTPSDYLHALRLFTAQHYLPDGKIDLVEDYDPDKGGPIVYFYWSNHYNHSSYNNLVITGLCGIRPSESDTLTINPIIDSTIKYFCLDDVSYHGHKLSVVYDEDGKKYNIGTGISVFVDGKKATLIRSGNKTQVIIGAAIKNNNEQSKPNFALNISKKGFPQTSASVNSNSDSLNQAVDGRIWYFPEISNRWTTLGSTNDSDWFAINFGTAKEISSIQIYPVVDDNHFYVPENVSAEYQKDGQWLKLNITQQLPATLTGNTENSFTFDKVSTANIRINFLHHKRAVAISEIKCS